MVMNNDRWQWGERNNEDRLTLIFDMQYTPEKSLHIHQHSGLDSDTFFLETLSVWSCLNSSVA